MIDITATTALLTFLPAAINIGIAFYTFSFLSRHRTVTLFGLLTLFMAFWQVADGLFISVATHEQALYVDRFFAFSWCIGGALAFHFACSYTGAAITRHRWFYLIYLPFFVLHCLYVSSTHSEMEFDPSWGWVNGARTGWIDALTLWVLAISMLVVIGMLVAHAWRMRRVPVRGPQALLVAVGMIVPTIAGIIFQVVFPLVLKRKEIPLSSELMTIFSLATVVALVRYRLFDAIEAIRVETVLQQFQNIILVVHPEGEVQVLNAYTARLFQVAPQARVHVRTLFGTAQEYEEFAQQVLQPALEGRSLRNNMVCFQPTDRRIDTLVATEPLRVRNKVQGVLVVANDITDYLLVVEERKRAERQLEEAQLQRHREITEAVVAAQENERRLIGAELHDNVNQILTSARLYLELAGTTASQRTQFLEQTGSIITRAMQEVRKLSHSLIPPSLSGETLVEALGHLLHQQAAGSPEVQLDVARFDEDSAPAKLKLAIYRIVQEQWSNVIKHAGATRIQVTLKNYKGSLLLAIQDDGVGFDTGITASGVGLKNMEARARLHDGRLSIRSEKGKGCLLQVEFPLRQTALPG